MYVDYRSANGYDVKAASDDAGLICDEPSLTVQSDAEDADINNIVRRYGVTGVLPMGGRQPSYADFDDVFDFQSAQNAIIEGTSEFMKLPAELRARFNNNPTVFMDFCLNPNNIDEMVKLGLAIAKEKPDNTPNATDGPIADSGVGNNG